MKFGKLNYVAVLIAVVVTMGIGFTWFGPVFGAPWMEEIGKTVADFEANFSYLPFVFAVISTVLAWEGMWTAAMSDDRCFALANFAPNPASTPRTIATTKS